MTEESIARLEKRLIKLTDGQAESWRKIMRAIYR